MSTVGIALRFTQTRNLSGDSDDAFPRAGFPSLESDTPIGLTVFLRISKNCADLVLLLRTVPRGGHFDGFFHLILVPISRDFGSGVVPRKSKFWEVLGSGLRVASLLPGGQPFFRFMLRSPFGSAELSQSDVRDLPGSGSGSASTKRRRDRRRPLRRRRSSRPTIAIGVAQTVNLCHSSLGRI